MAALFLRCFENKMLGNATLLLNIFFGNQVKRVKLTVESFCNFWASFVLLLMAVEYFFWGGGGGNYPIQIIG